MKVVVASEDPRVRAWLGLSLGPAWTVVDASNGVQARRVVADEHPDLVICDETMETYGAFGLARDLTATKDRPKILILLERAQDDWLAKWSGADRWLVRPVDPFAVATAARELMSMKPKEAHA